MAKTTTARQSTHDRYGMQYWTIILLLNIVALFKGDGLDKILFVDGLILALFGMAAIVTRIWRKRFL